MSELTLLTLASQLTGDCSEWFAGCPISLFKFVDDNLV